MAEDKPHLNVAFIGHVDHGKSTLIGRMMFEHGDVRDTMIKKFEEMGEKGKTFKFAWVMDNLKEERERGLTIDIAFFKFMTDTKYYTIIDAPGHKDFIKNMITGASQADVGLLVVSAKKGEFEAGVGPGGQTKEHAYLAMTLGVPSMIVCVNKMDDDSVKYSEDRYNEVKDEVEGFLKSIGFKTDKIHFIPTSALDAANLKEKTTDLTPWYKGPCLLEALEAVELPPKPVDKPLRLPINDVYSIKGVGTVPVGRVETGVMKPGQKITFMPPNKTGEVKSIEMHHEELPQAVPGDNIGFNIRGIERKDLGRGDVAGPPDKPPTVATDYTGQVMVIQHPSAITVGYTPVIHAHTAQVACRFDQIMQKIDQRSGQVIEENPDFVKKGESMLAKLIPLKPMCIETYKEFPQLGRFAVRDMGMTVAVGVVTKVTARK
jgi:elongation factor 1-alpha